jgi:hypothetical protein
MAPNFYNSHAASAVASNCVVVVDRFVFVFILAPLVPPALSRPAGWKRELTAIFGRVFEVRKYKLKSHVKTKLRAASQEAGANVGAVRQAATAAKPPSDDACP